MKLYRVWLREPARWSASLVAARLEECTLVERDSRSKLIAVPGDYLVLGLSNTPLAVVPGPSFEAAYWTEQMDDRIEV